MFTRYHVYRASRTVNGQETRWYKGYKEACTCHDVRRRCATRWLQRRLCETADACMYDDSDRKPGQMSIAIELSESGNGQDRLGVRRRICVAASLWRTESGGEGE
jgi:hypothetical protein